MDRSRNENRCVGRNAIDRLPVPARSLAIALVLHREDADHELAALACDVQVERVRRRVEPAE